MTKNIVVFSDGTGQEGGKRHSTNVYKLFNVVEDRTPRQIAFYDRGLGTGWRKVTGMAFGLGISKNIQECYQFIFDHYHEGDRIFLFGFSRGAYTVRSVSGFISLFGILPKSRPELIKEAYDIYKIDYSPKNQAKREGLVQDFKRRHRVMDCTVHFIGVWDTVGALGIPFKALDLLNPMKHSFHDTTLSPKVTHGRHALSIDDERLTFHPTLWDERNAATRERVKQVWFPGVHTDVGGGYEETGLSDISLQWMVAQAREQGLLIDEAALQNLNLKPDPDGVLHDPRSGLGRLYRRKRRTLTDKIVRPVLHKSVHERTRDVSNTPGSGYRPWILDHPHTVES